MDRAQRIMCSAAPVMGAILVAAPIRFASVALVRIASIQIHMTWGSGSKLGNACSPRNHLSGPPKSFFLDGDAKERAPKKRCQVRGVWGQVPPENFAEFALVLEVFVRFEPLKFLSVNKV